MRLLIERDCSVGEIAEHLPVSRPAVSKQLRHLEWVGLVQFRSDGNRNIYTLQPDSLALVRDEIDGMWRRALARFALVANNAPLRSKRRPKK